MEAPVPLAAAIERAQRRQLRATVAHAYEHVPYYRETMRRLGLGPADFETASDLAKLPLIEREQLQRDPEYFVSRAEPLAELRRASHEREHRRADQRSFDTCRASFSRPSASSEWSPCSPACRGGAGAVGTL